MGITYSTRRNSRRPKKNATSRLRGGGWHFFLVLLCHLTIVLMMHQSRARRALDPLSVPPLTNRRQDRPSKPNGLTKQTFSTQVYLPGAHAPRKWHIVAYFSVWWIYLVINEDISLTQPLCFCSLFSNIVRVMITPDCKRSMTLSNCVIFGFLMGSMFLARALTSEQIPSLASPMTMRAFTPLAVADHRAPVVPDHPRLT